MNRIKNLQQTGSNDVSSDSVFDLQGNCISPLAQLQPSFKKYKFLVGIRILLCVIPQLGYIHPDEFFQTVEIVGGDIFGVRVSRSWEYNCTFPIRTIVLPYLTTGIPLTILKHVSRLMDRYFGFNLLTPFGILITTRLAMCCLSFVSDVCLYKICKMYNYRFITHYLIVFASCYVVVVYGTRTFSNTVEMCLFSILLYLVAECMKEQKFNINFRTYLLKRYFSTFSVLERVKYMKILKTVPNCELRHCFLISTLTVIGCFNRPTFAVFAIGPVFFWIHRGLGSEFINFRVVHYRIFIFLISSIPSLIFFIVVDSFYFGYISFPEIQSGDVSINSFVVTPLNFLRYNLNPNNLAKHGLHPRYLHVLLNVPLLYSILAVAAYISVVAAVWRLIRRRKQGKAYALSLRNLMFVAMATPIVVLSLFPHQEPRFLVPLVLPMVFLYSHRINKKTLLKAWFVINIIQVIFYGFVHQAGVVQLAKFLTSELQQCLPNCTLHVITSHMYEIPQVLLQQPDDKMKTTYDGYSYRKIQHIFLYELGSSSSDQIYNKVSVLQLKTHLNKSWHHQIYVAIPSVLKNSFQKIIKKDSDLKYDFHETTVLFPHLSTEVFSNPDFNGFFVESDIICNIYWDMILFNLKQIYYTLGLSIYKFEKALYYIYNKDHEMCK